VRPIRRWSDAAARLLPALLVASCTVPLPQPGGGSARSVSFEQTESVEALGNRVAGWQLAHLGDFSYVRTFREDTADPRGWIRAAFWIGLSRWAEATGDPMYRRAVLERAEANGWRLGNRPWHADDQAIAQVYLHLARAGEPARLDAVVDAFDAILASPPTTSLEFTPADDGHSEGTCQRRWCWCDALFMAPPAWAMLSAQTGDAKYLDYALDEYFATRDYLYDDREWLFYRDSRFFDARTPHGKKVFWSRGNGWVFAGLPLLLEAVPAGHPRREELVTLYREMAAKLAEIQEPSGFWSPSLLDGGLGAVQETSGTGFITFGLAWGINEGLLPEADYGPVVDRAWEALRGAVNADGRLGWVQQVGNAPDEVLSTDTQLYGTGALLLAASEILKR
jgi:rhamnogalacturonyl hydrolase YesR